MTVATQTLAAGEEGDRRAAQMAAGGASLGQIAAAFFPPLSIEHARAAVARGRQQLTDLAPKPTPVIRPAPQPSPPAPEATPDPVEQLLTWAEKDGPARAATLAARTRSQLTELTTLRSQHTAAALQRKLVAALEKQLAQARAELRRMTSGQKPTASKPAATDPVVTPAQQIRAWARENGYEVAGNGLIPKAIAEAYHAVHGGSGAEGC